MNAAPTTASDLGIALHEAAMPATLLLALLAVGMLLFDGNALSAPTLPRASNDLGPYLRAALPALRALIELAFRRLLRAASGWLRGARDAHDNRPARATERPERSDDHDAENGHRHPLCDSAARGRIASCGGGSR